ncbi:MAG TPA: hypothetical protein VE956_11110 [Nodularia sp. (in: cyanobacteria)]|nr:hypothetical protein [Nodularia sp. (in: cyanobacteria)]
MLYVVTGHQSALSRVAFSPDKKMIASASPEGTIKIWMKNGDRLSEKPLHTLEAHRGFCIDAGIITN